MTKFFKLYIDIFWLPFAISLTAYFIPQLIAGNLGSNPAVYVFVQNIVPKAYFLSIFGMFIIGIIQLIRKEWAKGLGNFILIPVSIISVAFMYILGFSQDNFGKDIHIPTHVKVEKAIESNPWSQQKGDEQDILLDDLAEFKKNPVQIPEVKSNLIIQNISFPEFNKENRKLLLRHLATSCRWRLSHDLNGKLFATRRFILNGQWQGDDYYGDVQGKAVFIFPDGLTSFTQREYEYEGSRFRIKTFTKSDTQPIKLKIGKNNAGAFPPYRCKLELSSGKSVLRIDDTDGQSVQKLLDSFGNELKAVLNSNTAKEKGYDASLMPDFSIQTGEAQLKVFENPSNNFTPGYYAINAFINPQEEGSVYLKIFEATTNVPLDVRWDSVEYTGWSDNPDEKFFYSYSLTIEEGQPSWSYPARFELWFKSSDSQKPDRKLIERIYSVSGYEH